MNSALATADIGVVVCTYQMERWDQLLACLESLQQQTLKPQDVVVVVDGSAEVAAALQQRQGPEQIVALEKNGGLSTARNAGVAELSNKWIAFLDDDAAAEDTWLELLYEACQEMSTVGAGGWSAANFTSAQPSWFPDELLWTVGCSHRGLPLERTLVRNVFGGCALLESRLFELVGGFDPHLGRIAANAGGGEEADFCRRVLEVAPTARFAHVPKAIIRHRVGLERLTPFYLVRRCYQEGRAKATLASRGTDALTPERNFVTQVAPRGIALSIRERRPAAGAVLVAGVFAAAFGYLRVRSAGMRSPASRHLRSLGLSRTKV